MDEFLESFYIKAIHQLIDSDTNRETIGRGVIGPPYPRQRYIYLVSPDERHRFYKLLDIIGIPYYLNRFSSAKDLPDSGRIPEEMHWLKPVEVLEKIDEQRLEAIRKIVPTEYYAGVLEFDIEKGKPISLTPEGQHQPA